MTAPGYVPFTLDSACRAWEQALVAERRWNLAAPGQSGQQRSDDSFPRIARHALWATDTAGETLSTPVATVLAQGLEWCRYHAAIRFREAFGHLKTVTEAGSECHTRWRDALTRLAWCDNDLRALRDHRRRSVRRALERFQLDGDGDALFENAIQPLLDRHWLAPLFWSFEHDDAFANDLERTPFRNVAARARSEMFAGREKLTGASSDSVIADAIEEYAPGDHVALATAAFLRAALPPIDERDALPMVTVPVLLVPDTDDLLVAHVVDIVLLSERARGSSDRWIEPSLALEGASTTPALAAVNVMLSVPGGQPVELPRLLAAIGDLPGGVDVPPHIHGPSAGLSIAAGLLATVCGLRWMPAALASAALEPNGVVSPLRWEAGLLAKGRALALHGATRFACAGDDAVAITAGIEQVDPAHAVTVHRIAHARNVDGVLLEDPYLSLLESFSDDESPA